jgi:hypothetical protein
MHIPIACTLTEDQMRDRRREILEPFREKTYQSETLPDGYAYTFDASTGMLVEFARLVDLERQCCPFLSFHIAVQAGAKSIRLEITGPPEAKPLISDFFGAELKVDLQRT